MVVVVSSLGTLGYLAQRVGMLVRVVVKDVYFAKLTEPAKAM
jgi:hypothetical protein